MHATRTAVEEGIVPGGGVALPRASMALKSLKIVGGELADIPEKKQPAGPPHGGGEMDYQASVPFKDYP